MPLRTPSIVVLFLASVAARADDWIAFPLSPLERLYASDAPTEVRTGEADFTARAASPAIAITAAPGQIEPFAFGVFSRTPVAGVTAAIEPPRDVVRARPLPAGWCEFFAVKSIYRNVNGWRDPAAWRPRLNEMLVKDDRLWSTDPETRSNMYAWPGADRRVFPDDAAALLPVDVQAGEPRQFYIRVRVPADAVPGTYAADVVVRAGAAERRLPVSLRVLPITLLPSVKSHLGWVHLTCDVHAEPMREGAAPADFNRFGPAQYRAALRDFAEHGWVPSVCAADEESARASLGWMRDLGMLSPDKPVLHRFYEMPDCIRVRSPDDALKLAAHARKLKALGAEFGCPPLMTYVDMDLIVPEGVWPFAPGWHVVTREAGLNCATGVDGDQQYIPLRRRRFQRFADLLQVPVFTGHFGLGPADAAVLHARHPGSRVLFHALPYMTQPWPCNIRTQFGFTLWRMGFDGVFPYVITGISPEGWSYWSELHEGKPARTGYGEPYGIIGPSRSGLIDSLTWEACRDAVTDTRYCTTLAAQVAAAKRLKLDRPEIAEAAEFLLRGLAAAIPPETEFYVCVRGPASRRDGRAGYAALQAIRGRLIDHILALEKASPELATSRVAALPGVFDLARLQSYEGVCPAHDTPGLLIAEGMRAARDLAYPPIARYRDDLRVREPVCFYPDDVEVWREFRDGEFRREGEDRAHAAWMRCRMFMDVMEAQRSAPGAPFSDQAASVAGVAACVEREIKEALLSTDDGRRVTDWAATFANGRPSHAEAARALADVFGRIEFPKYRGTVAGPMLRTAERAEDAGWLTRNEKSSMIALAQSLRANRLGLEEAEKVLEHAQEDRGAQTRGSVLVTACRLAAAAAASRRIADDVESSQADTQAIEAEKAIGALLRRARDAGLLTAVDVEVAGVYGGTGETGPEK